MEYQETLERAVSYVEEHMGENFTAEDVAKVSGYSYYHLTRVFQERLGEGLGSYVRKRRLAQAAQQLLYTHSRVLDIALACGFASSEAFSRAFKSAYHTSPWAYRKRQVDTLISYKYRMDLPRLAHLLNNVSVHPRIVEKPSFFVAGLRGETTLEENKLADLWGNFHSVSSGYPLFSTACHIGVCESCSAGNTFDGMGSQIPFTELVGVVVSDLEGIPDPLVGKQVQGGRYAVFTHKGSLEKLPLTFEYIWGTWLLATKEELEERDCFELYDDRFLGYAHPLNELDIYIPVR